MKSKFLLVATVLAVATTSVAALSMSPKPEKWDMPLAYSASNFHSKNAEAFAKCVAGGTNDRIQIATHPSGSLFKGNDIKRAVQTGQAPIGERLLSAHQNENALFGVDSIPFLATSYADSEKLWEAARPTIERVLADQNLVYLYAVPWPPQGFYFKKQIDSVAAMEGIKFRAYNAATARLAELVGMRPVQIEAAELSQALATGVADAFLSSAATGYDRKVWEQVEYFYEVEAWLPRNTVMVNKQVWDRLDDDTRAAIRACADQAAKDGLEASKKYNVFTVNGLREGGMTVLPPQEQLRNELIAVGKTMSDEWLKNAGATGKDIVEKFKTN